MNKAIIGKYLNIETPIHKLDPRLKFLANILFIILFFIADHFITLGVLVLSIMIIYIMATKSIKSCFLKLKLPLYIAIFIFIVNMLTIKGAEPDANGAFIPLSSLGNADSYVFYRGETIVNTIYWAPFGITKPFQITKFTLYRTASIFLRIYGVILTTTILTVTTKPVLLTRAINDLLFPLKIFKIPTEIITMIISIALRFIPTLLEESNRIMKAQSSRGVDFKNGNIKDKAKSFLVLIIPLFVSSFTKANDLSDAMTSRGYEPYAKRSHYRDLRPNWRDFVALTFIILASSMVIVCQLDAVALPTWWIATFQKV
ncbi:energy-coupling factor transporter transmembrane component T family protein [Mycoplasma struthionis]|uniref:Energy-coupling factor transporter transmembrane protein EcfT n=1 Tax=Mycoplasma struthionis TaxID=538220 RepID=A0A3G8LJL0_9MOLU|nr:energy-coupling factor transporter transmembrane component T [Mycoplasma struthionis]AZG68828.1 energy-coupling factor transporter transmembrane protein EcfT [Mycoplasma struthionis]TPI01494.1 energy-coupling factor transporter transmembrane protein EcfT [Mycoplasma struthionis]